MRTSIGAVTVCVVIGVTNLACNGRSAAADGSAAGETSRLAAEAGPAAAPGTGSDARTGETRRPEWREVTIPAGTALALVLDTPVASDTSRVEQPVRAHLAQPVVVDGVTAIPAGSTVTGTVTDAVRSGRVKGRAQIAVAFDTLVPAGENATEYDLRANTISRRAAATKKDDAVKIAAPAAGGAVIGGIVGGKKGALIGGAAGGGAGAAVVMSTRGDEVRLGKGASLTLRLSEPLTVRIRA